MPERLTSDDTLRILLDDYEHVSTFSPEAYIYILACELLDCREALRRILLTMDSHEARYCLPEYEEGE